MAVDILSTLNKNGSGLNLRDLTTSLVAAEIAPLVSAQEAKKKTAELSISALGQVRAQMATLNQTMAALRENPVLQATSSHAGVAVTITDAAKITDQTRNIEVVQTAKRQVLEFSGFAAADALVGAGVLQIETGVWVPGSDGAASSFAVKPDSTVHRVNIPEGATVSMLAEVLNGIPGMQARLVDKGDGTFSLGVVSENGAGSAFRFTAEPTVEGLGAFDTTATNDTVQIQAAQDAILSVDGIDVFRPTNVVDDLIPGASIEVTAQAGATATVGFTRDIETARVNMAALVEQLNGAKALLASLSARGVGEASAGPLAGDRLVETMKRDLQAIISAPLGGFGGAAKFLSDFGVATNRDGTMRLDAPRFETAFKADPASFETLFDNRMAATDARVVAEGVLGDAAVAGRHVFARDPATGTATLDGEVMMGVSLGDGRSQYMMFRGAMSGMILTVPDDVTTTEVSFGRSFLSKLDVMMNRLTATGTGSVTERETQLQARVTEAEDRIVALDLRATMLEKRTLSRFTAMETAIAGLKSTGNYLTNLVAQWNKSS